VTYEAGSSKVADLTDRSVSSLIRDDILSDVKSVSLSLSDVMREALIRCFVGDPLWE
jgi:hypothetical protein